MMNNIFNNSARVWNYFPLDKSKLTDIWVIDVYETNPDDVDCSADPLIRTYSTYDDAVKVSRIMNDYNEDV